jgi:hypothetical protein
MMMLPMVTGTFLSTMSVFLHPILSWGKDEALRSYKGDWALVEFIIPCDVSVR